MVVTYTKRVQTVLTEEQFELLSHLAQELDKPVSVLIREAVEDVYFEQAQRERRRAALTELLSLDAPVAEWEAMEDEIVRGAQGMITTVITCSHRSGEEESTVHGKAGIPRHLSHCADGV